MRDKKKQKKKVGGLKTQQTTTELLSMSIPITHPPSVYKCCVAAAADISVYGITAKRIAGGTTSVVVVYIGRCCLARAVMAT